jgi:hypothetical protein
VFGGVVPGRLPLRRFPLAGVGEACPGLLAAPGALA